MLLFFATSLGGRDSSSITKSQNTFSTILLCSIAVTALETNDPETLFKFSYKRVHSQQSFALVLLLFGTWEQKRKAAVISWGTQNWRSSFQLLQLSLITLPESEH